MIVFQWCHYQTMWERQHKRKVNVWKTKIMLHHNYDRRQIAGKLGVTEATVRNYIKTCENISLEGAREGLKSWRL